MRCRACRRPLSDPVSIKHGFGPQCLKRAVEQGQAPLDALVESAEYRRDAKKTPRSAPPPVDTQTGDLFEQLKAAALDDMHKAASVLQSLGVGVEIILCEQPTRRQGSETSQLVTPSD